MGMLYYNLLIRARLAKLANALGLGPSTERFAGSSPASRTSFHGGLNRGAEKTAPFVSIRYMYNPYAGFGRIRVRSRMGTAEQEEGAAQ